MSEVTSIGPTWPPEASSHERLRGFTYEVADTGDDAESLADTFDRLTAENFQSNISRVALRAVVNNEHIGTLSETLESTNPASRVEAALPIFRHETLDNHSIVYLGHNHADRAVSNATYDDYAARLERVIDRPSTPPSSTEASLHIVNPDNTQHLTEAFGDLYKPFGYDEAEVRDVLANPHNTIAYLEKDGRIVSTSMAEHATVKTEAGNVEIAEVTEASTLPELRGKGLYSLCLNGLVKQLQARRDIHSVYGESNLSTDKVIRAAHQTGRRFSYEDAAQLDVKRPGFGILPQNFPVNDGVETRPYNDFAVGYYTLEGAS